MDHSLGKLAVLFSLSLLTSTILPAQDYRQKLSNTRVRISGMDSLLKGARLQETSTTLLSIPSLLSYLTPSHVVVPLEIIEALAAGRVIEMSPKSSGGNIRFLSRYFHSSKYNSYLLLVSERVGTEEDDQLILINVQGDSLLSACQVAMRHSGVGLAIHGFSIYRGGGKFELIIEDLGSDIEYKNLSDKLKAKELAASRVQMSIDIKSARILRK
jgi:hypothetical protein